jgi:pyrroloquinoline quinone (PQQ) biosynthesis protein C
MEHFACAFSRQELDCESVLANRRFVRRLEERLSSHRLYDHPVNCALAAGEHGPEALRFVFVQMLHIIEPYTAMLSLLAGQAPDLRSRHVLFDNLYEEMGRGNIDEAHPMLWRRLLHSIGAGRPEARLEAPLPSIARMNRRMREALLGRRFPVACAWLSFSELPIPNIFGYLVRATDRMFQDLPVDRTFFDRHGIRDEGHAEDAHLLTSLYAAPTDHAAIESEALEALDLRAAVWDEFQARLSRQPSVRAQKPLMRT